MVPRYVIDACAWIAYLRDEEGGLRLEELLKQESSVFLMHAVTLGEVYYDIWRYSGKDQADKLFEDLARLPVQVVWEIDRTLLERVGYYKTSYRVSYADCFVLGLADREKATVISTDHHEFDVLEKAKVLSFYWLR
jgi:PIN domain nuclease of toxin-antitoxin system